MPTRETMWQVLRNASGDPYEVDLLVLGGGITGAGVARDAARRGLRVALVEMRDLASGTSSRSSKLVHGGLRYLQQYELGLVFESVNERRVLTRIAPHLVNPLAFLFPVYERSSLKLWYVAAGLWLYDGLSLFRSHRLHRTVRARRLLELEPTLGPEGLVGAPLYWDAATDDARLTLETALDAIAHGAVVVPWCRAAAWWRDDAGQVIGAEVEDVLTGERRRVRAHQVVNCTGPWTDMTLALDGAPRPRLLRRTKGVHVVVERTKLPVQHAIVCVHPRDGRVLFAIPWADRTYLGTTDTDFDGDPHEVAASADDVDYLLEAAAAYFPAHPLRPEDVVSTWAGIRPLVAPEGEPDGVAESNVSREHTIRTGADGAITVAGGKLTTYRRMAREIVDLSVARLVAAGRAPAAARRAPATHREPLPGARGWPADDDHAAVARAVVEASGLPEDVARNLVDTYGTRAHEVAERCRAEPALAERLVPGRPEILAQVDHAVLEELATRLVDVMVRRTQLFFRDLDQGLGADARAADRMATLLAWPEARRAAELEAYREEVARSRRWRAEPVSRGQARQEGGAGAAGEPGPPGATASAGA